MKHSYLSKTLSSGLCSEMLNVDCVLGGATAVGVAGVDGPPNTVADIRSNNVRSTSTWNGVHLTLWKDTFHINDQLN